MKASQGLAAYANVLSPRTDVGRCRKTPALVLDQEQPEVLPQLGQTVQEPAGMVGAPQSWHGLSRARMISIGSEGVSLEAVSGSGSI